MVSKRRVCGGLVLLCVVSPGTRAYAQRVSDPVADVLAALPTPPSTFVAISPCRLADTRGNGFSGPLGPPSLLAATPRVFPVVGNCGIPSTATVVSANLAVTNTSDRGFLSLWPEGAPQPNPLGSSMNYSAGQTIANAALAALGTGGGITVYTRVGLDLVIDVNGYFEAGTGPAGIMVAGFNGHIFGAITGSAAAFVFAGPTATVTTTATQRLTGSAEAPIGLAEGSSDQTAEIDLCYQPNAGGTLTNFNGMNSSSHVMFSDIRTYSAAGTVVPGAGTWKVGLCVRNNGGTASISRNDYVNGWVMVTN
jgi:hypothetical protein